MLSYRHNFHAGNHADIVKHIVETLIIQSLTQKEKPFIYHDTHSGAGRYDLTNDWAEKTGEFKQGIARIWEQPDTPQLIQPYLDAVKAINPTAELHFYPGSPLIAKTFIRPQDRMTLTELHPSDFPLLLNEFRRDHQVRLFNDDAYLRLKSRMPPKERRGLVLIDPPYELKTEYQDVVKGIHDAYKRWATGIYAIWYPVVYRENVDLITTGLARLGIRKILQIELGVEKDSTERGMTASGMIVINPPWKLKSQMEEILPWLQKKIAPDTGHHSIQWVVPE